MTSLLGKIKTDIASDSNKDIGPYLTKYMTCFLHNRIGTYLKENEVSNKRNDARDISVGQILVCEDGTGNYKFVLVLKIENSVCTFLTKENPDNKDFVEKQLHISALYNYSQAEPILQSFKPNETGLNEDDLLETYIIKK